MTRSLLCCFSLVFSLAACAQDTQKFDDMLRSLYKNSVPLIQSEELRQTRNLIILDTREWEEYATSHLPNALWVGYDNFQWQTVDQFSRDAQIVVYCSVGYRSERVGEWLQQRGFTRVRNLYGGIFDWFNRGNPVHNLAGMPTDSVHTYNRKWSRWLTRGKKVY